MTVKDLKTKYPHSRTSVAINAAIRAELPGGAEVLTVCEMLPKLKYNTLYEHRFELAKLIETARARMILEIRRRYGLPEMEDE